MMTICRQMFKRSALTSESVVISQYKVNIERKIAEGMWALWQKLIQSIDE